MDRAAVTFFEMRATLSFTFFVRTHSQAEVLVHRVLTIHFSDVPHIILYCKL